MAQTCQTLFRAQLNDPEFAKQVKGLECMLRVRDRMCATDLVCVPGQVRNFAREGGVQDAGAVAPSARMPELMLEMILRAFALDCR